MTKAKSKSQGWTTPAQLRLQVQRLWDRGELLRGVLDDLILADGRSESGLPSGDDSLEADLFPHSETPATDVSVSLHDPVAVTGMSPESDTLTTDPSMGNGTMPSDELLGFPLRLKLKKPSSRDIGDRFSEVRAWVQSLTNIRHTRLELQETRHPQLGRNAIPQSLWIDSLDDAIAFIGKRDECHQFCAMVVDLMAYDMKLVRWVKKRPVKVLELASVWERLLRVHQGIVEQQDTVTYLRQLSVSGVDTKFIEAHRGILAEWLDMTLPANSIHTDHRGTRGFVRRYGFKDKPVRIRLRSLDSTQALFERGGLPSSEREGVLATADITLDVDVIRLLDPAQSRVIITENEINYLVLPDREGTLAVFGSGYGLQSLGEIDWLQQRDVWYWGDIDTHGFAILNELRTALPEVRSILMDRDTLMAHETLWGHESKPANRNLEHLEDEEAELYRDLVDCRYGDGVRLEQEQIDYEFMLSRLERIADF